MKMRLNNIVLMLLSIALTNAKLIMIIRHGEKLNDDVTDLSPTGKARAQCLVNVFGSNGTYLTPQKIFAQSPSEKKQSTRPRDTVTPLADSLGLTVDLSYTSGQIKKLTNDILSSNNDVILISWSNDKIPEIAEKLGIQNPPEWKSKVFDKVWMIYDSQTTSYLKNSVNKRAVYTGTNGFNMEIVDQNINPCVKENVKNFQSSQSSGSSKLTNNLFITLASLIAFYLIHFF